MEGRVNARSASMTHWSPAQCFWHLSEVIVLCRWFVSSPQAGQPISARLFDPSTSERRRATDRAGAKGTQLTESPEKTDIKHASLETRREIPWHFACWHSPLWHGRFSTSGQAASVPLLKSATEPWAKHPHVTKRTSSIGTIEDSPFQR